MNGTITLPDGNPATTVQVNLYRSTSWPRWSYITTTQTSAAGTYQFDGLGQGLGIDYRVQFVDPTYTYASEYYANQLDIDQATSVFITLGETRAGIDAELTPLATATVQLVKSATPALTITNGSDLTYTLVLSASADTPLHLYDPLSGGLTWQGFVGTAPDTLSYTTGALTGTVALSATTPLTVTFAVQANLPAASFVSEYAQVANTAYYYFPGQTLAQKQPSNTVIRTVYKPGGLHYLVTVGTTSLITAMSKLAQSQSTGPVFCTTINEFHSEVKQLGLPSPNTRMCYYESYLN